MDELGIFSVTFWMCLTLFANVLVSGQDPQRPPYFTSEPSDVIVSKNSKVVLECSAAGNPKPNIIWKRNGDFINNLDTDTRRRILPSGSLEIDKVIHDKKQRPDEGEYRCVAVSQGTTRTYTLLSRLARLKVASMSSKFSMTPQDRTAQSGDTVQLNCKPKFSVPQPLTVWKYEANTITENDRFTVLPSGSLQIRNVQQSDSGRYKCTVINSMVPRVIESDYATLSVTKASTSPSGPRFIAVPRDTNVTVNEDVVLECAVNSNPRPEITWMKGSSALPVQGRIQLVGGSNLKISNAVASDSGMYSCVATTGSDPKLHMGYLKVQTPPVFVKKPQSVIAKYDDSTKFDCVVEGVPKPTVLWYKDGDRIIDSDFVKVGDGDLSVIGLVSSDQGVYQCIATNVLGSIQSSAELIVYTKDEEKPTFPLPLTTKPTRERENPALEPSAPRNLGSRMLMSTSVVLFWDEPEITHDLPVSYRLMYGETGKGLDGSLNTTAKQTRITDLTPGKTYQFVVFAYNKYGAGLVSDSVTVKMDTDNGVIDPPVNVKAIAVSSSEVRVEWDKPEISQNIQRFSVHYKESGSLKTASIVEAISEYKKLSGLLPSTEYSVWVRSVLRDGRQSSPSEEVTVTTGTADTSSTPQNVRLRALTSHSLLVEWDPPQKIKGLIQAYNIKLRDTRFKNSTIIKEPASRTRTTITGLRRNVEYAVRIAYETGDSVSDFSAPWVKATTLNIVLVENVPPGQPRNFRAQVVSNTIALSWDPPAEDHIMVRRYELSYGKKDPYENTRNVSFDAKAQVLRRLEPMANYFIKLRACNNKGCSLGKQIMETTGKTVELHLEPLKDVKAESKSSLSMHLTWREPQLTSSRRTYNIKYRRYNSTEDLEFYNTTKRSYTINGLKPDTYYSFFVKRQGEKWGEKPSVFNNTMEGAPSAPKDLTPVTIYDDPTEIELQWQLPDNPNGQIIEYRIYYTTDKTVDDSQQAIEKVKDNVFTATLKGLTKNTKYYVKMKAKTKAGWGEMSDTLEIKTLAAPYVPSPPNTTPPSSVEGDAGAIAGGDLAAGGSEDDFDNKTLWIIIAGVAGVTFIAIVVISVILCLRRSGDDIRPKRPAYRPTYKAAVAANGSAKKKGGKEDKNKKSKSSDLWISHENTEMTTLTANPPQPESPPASPASRVPKIAEEMEPLQKAPLDQQQLDQKRNSFNSGSGNSEPSTPILSQKAPMFSYPSDKRPLDNEDALPSPPWSVKSPEDSMFATPEKSQDAPLFHSTPRQNKTLPRSLSLENPKPNDYIDNTSFPAPPRHHSYDPLDQDAPNSQQPPSVPPGNRTYNAPYSPKKSPDQPYSRAPGYRPPGRFSPNGYVTLPHKYDDIGPRRVPQSAKSVEIMNDLDKEIAGLEGLMKDLNAITAQHYRV